MFKSLIPLMAFGSLALAQTASVTVNLASEKQTIRGFGGMNHRVWTGYDLSATDRDLAFGNGPGQIGLTVLRIWISDNESQWSLELPTAKDVIARGGIVYASPWNPPTALRVPYTLVRWGTTYQTHKVDPAKYADYAAHLNKFAQYMKNNGAPLYAISMQNEPDWCDSWTCWSADEVYNFIKAHGNTLRQNGTKVITAESFNYSKSYYDKILNDAAALANIDIIGAHFYGSTAATADNFFQYPLADQKATGKERWMTEHYTDSKGNGNLWRGYIITGDQDQTPQYDTVRALDVAYEIHRALVEGNFNQYTWWYIRRNYGLIIHDTQNNVQPQPTVAEVGKVSKRGYCIAQYAKFVRPGSIRVEATKKPSTHVYVSAFKRADSVIIVAVNRANQQTINFSVPGANIASWRKYTTSATKNVNDDGAIAASNGSFTATLDQESVTTFVGIRSTASSSSAASSSAPRSSATNSSSVASSSSRPAQSSSSAFERRPYSANAIPGLVQAEHYDLGGEGVTYHDNDTVNSGGVYRSDGVDITGNATDGYKIGWTIAGEWLEYTVTVANAGVYRWEARVSAGGDGGAFRIALNGTDLSGPVSIPNTGSWDTYTTVSGTTPRLNAGQQTLRLTIEGSYLNLDWIRFTEESTPLNALTQAQPATQWRIYNALGAEIGQVEGTADQLPAQIRLLCGKPGIYVARSGKHQTRVTVSRSPR